MYPLVNDEAQFTDDWSLFSLFAAYIPIHCEEGTVKMYHWNSRYKRQIRLCEKLKNYYGEKIGMIQYIYILKSVVFCYCCCCCCCSSSSCRWSWTTSSMNLMIGVIIISIGLYFVFFTFFSFSLWPLAFTGIAVQVSFIYKPSYCSYTNPYASTIILPF